MKFLDNTHIRSFAVAALLSTAVAAANAVPAKQGPIVVDQPDGTQLTIRLVGDEYGHITYSEDGYPLLYDDALGYVYANVESDGSLTATRIKANNIAARTATELNFINGLTTDKIATAATHMQKNAVARKPTGAKKAVMQKGPGLCTSTYPVTGVQKALVILVEYSDVKFGSSNSSDFKYSDYGGAHQYFSDMLNKSGFSGSGATGSARDWFLQNSLDANGKSQFEPEFDVYGPVTLPNLMAYYGGNDSSGNDRNPQKMAIHACQILDDEVDFSQYDRDHDGYVDNIYIIYAGFGEASGGIKNTVWPHSWDINSAGEGVIYKFDGVIINHYACSNESDYSYKRPDGIGTFVHEFSHVMGLPDLYATNYSYNAYTPNQYSVLDYGPYNNDGRTPPNYSSYERYALGWMEPKTFNETKQYTLKNLADTNDGYIVKTEKDSEWFLVENRQQTGWDTYLPGHGMLIWHIDYVKGKFDGNTVNNTASHQYVDLIEANGKKTSTQAAGHPFPGTANVTSYTFTSWSDTETGVKFTDIAEDNGVISVYAENSNYDPNGVDEIGVDAADAAVEYYNLQGIRVLNPEKGELLIKRSGSTATKVIY